MQTQPQPIASNSRNNDYNMGGSYTGTGANGSFNPSSYTRHFLGSPLSWRPDSLGSQYYAGNQYNSVESQSDLKRMSTSYENDRGAFFNAISAFDREGELCRNYTCCGIHLTDLHALLEHFEEVHVVVIDPNPANPQTQVTIPFNPQPAPDPALFSQHQQQMYMQQQQAQQSLHQTSPQMQSAQAMALEQIGPFDPDDMDMGLDSSAGGSSRTPSSGAPTPPETPVSTPQFSSYSNPALNLNVNAQSQFSNVPAYHSQPSSPSLISAFETTTVVPRAFLGAGPYGNPYMPSLGNSSSLANANGPSPHIKSNQPTNDVACGVAPAALFSSSTARQSGSGRTTSTSAHVTPNPSRVPSPSGRYPNSSPPSPTHSSADKSAGGVQRLATTSSRPSTSMLLSKPFRCPKPNCNKSYKQANGLKYHLTHGSCSFAPAREVEQVQALLAARSSSGANSVPGSPAVEHTEEELLEVEKEAERHLKPYACGVSDCQRRYKNMNGLRYHYQHSGDHGAIGLALLASGQHEACARNGQSGVGRERRGGGSRAPSRASTPPNATQGHSVSGMNTTTAHTMHGQQPYPTQGFTANAFNNAMAQQQQRQGPIAMPVQMGFVGGARYDLTGGDVSMGMTQ